MSAYEYVGRGKKIHPPKCTNNQIINFTLKLNVLCTHDKLDRATFVYDAHSIKVPQMIFGCFIYLFNPIKFTCNGFSSLFHVLVDTHTHARGTHSRWNEEKKIN